MTDAVYAAAERGTTMNTNTNTMPIYDLSKLPAHVRVQAEQSTLFTKFPSTLLGVDTNAKTIKGQKKGFVTAILYLTPADGSGEQLCAMAELAKCKTPCLNTAGRGAMSNVQMARLRKTLFFLQYRAEFMALLVKELQALVRKYGDSLLVRLNGTSDIRWELIPAHIETQTGTATQTQTYANIMQAFPTTQFYDYTKIANRKTKFTAESPFPANYDLTFSYSGVVQFKPYVQRAKQAGMRIAVVFSRREGIPASFDGMQCVDGDDTDVRHLDPQGVAVALYAKGKAKTDTSGFVVQV